MAIEHPAKAGRPYDPRAYGDGLRVLVDRIWPRGLSKQTADLDEWCKQIAPPTTASGTATIRSASTSWPAATETNSRSLSVPRRSRTYASWPHAER